MARISLEKGRILRMTFCNYQIELQYGDAPLQRTSYRKERVQWQLKC